VEMARTLHACGALGQVEPGGSRWHLLRGLGLSRTRFVKGGACVPVCYIASDGSLPLLVFLSLVSCLAQYTGHSFCSLLG
jgi:hypothetical protein